MHSLQMLILLVFNSIVCSQIHIVLCTLKLEFPFQRETHISFILHEVCGAFLSSSDSDTKQNKT